MDLDFTMEEEQFRAEVRAFLKAKLPARIADKVRTGKRLTKKDHEEWHAILHERGWLASHLPPESGGPGWTSAKAHKFVEEGWIAASTEESRRGEGGGGKR